MTDIRARAAARPAALLRWLRTGWVSLIMATLAGTAATPPLAAQSLTGEVATETRAFANVPLYDGQERHDASFVIAPELYVRAGPGGFVVEPFGRLDASDDAIELEERVMQWTAQLLGLPEGFTGVIEDTASTASLCALLSAAGIEFEIKISATTCCYNTYMSCIYHYLSYIYYCMVYNTLLLC